MTLHADTFWSQLDSREARLVVRDTHWGFIVAEKARKKTPEFAAEAILKVLAIAILFASIVPVVMTSTPFGDGSLALRLAFSAATFVIGFGVFTHAGRGFAQEIHVDTVQNELRIATRNSRNLTYVRRRIPMDRIESCFLNRSKTSTARPVMYLRLAGKPQPLAIARGLERELVPLLERLADAIKNARRTGRF